MLPVPYLRQFLGSLLSRNKGIVKISYLMPSQHLEREVFVDVYRPAVPPWRLLQLVVFNDGQDLEEMDVRGKVGDAFATATLKPTLVVGVHAGDRMREYGSSKRLDYEGRGDRARQYERFIIQELMPWIVRRYNIYRAPERRAIAGFSLGGLSAFDIAWRNPGKFGRVGVFSGSFWYRHKPFNPARPDADRIVHGYVLAAKKPPPLRFWFMAGTEDEVADRNNNGVIDAIDDTLQLMALLEQKGYDPETALAYQEVEGGRHEPATWATVLLDFLQWI